MKKDWTWLWIVIIAVSFTLAAIILINVLFGKITISVEDCPLVQCILWESMVYSYQ